MTHSLPSWLKKKRAHQDDSSPKAVATKGHGWKKNQKPIEKRFARGPVRVRREIIVDSGASKHMIGIDQLKGAEIDPIRDLSVPFTVQTAHGVVPCKHEARIYIHDLKQWVWAQLLEDSPAVLSLGLLCTQMGYSYYWEEGEEQSYLVKMAGLYVARLFAMSPPSL